MDDVTVLSTCDDDGIATVTLNRPKQLNAFNHQMLEDFSRVIAQIDRDPACRVVILTGNGRAFSAGADVKMFNEGFFTSDEEKPPFFRALDLPDIVPQLERLTKPVIAAVNGVAVGEGLELALASDFRVAAVSAKLGFPEAAIGLIPASGGCSRIVKHVGLMRAKELFMRGGMLSAEEAHRAGLLTTVVPDDDLMKVALELATELLSKAPLSLTMLKAVLTACASSDMTTGHVLEVLAQNVLIKTQDHLEGVQAFVGKRPPRWIGR